MMKIAIGVGVPLRGPSAALGEEMMNAVTLAVEEHSSGAPTLELVVIDDEGVPRIGARRARELCARGDVIGVVGHYHSDVTMSASEIYEEHGIAMITPVASNPVVTERRLPHVFRFTNRDDRTAAAIANHLCHALGRRRGVIVATSTLYGRSMATEFARTFSRAGGTIAEQFHIGEGERALDRVVASFPRSVDVVFYGGSFEGAALLGAMRSAGMTTLLATGDGCWDRVNFLAPAGSAAMAGEGVLVLSATPEIGRVARSTAFASRYAARFGPIGNYAVNAYDAARVLLAAAGRAEFARSGVADALRTMRFQGLAYRQPTMWDDRGDNLAAVTALHIVVDREFRQVSEIDVDGHSTMEDPERRYFEVE
jgi:branched-chain amino acid transport system substrate-binding protein